MFSSPDVAVVFGIYSNNFVVRVLAFSTLYLLREGWVSSCFLEYAVGIVTNTFTEHIMFEGRMVMDDNYVDGM
jgi:hypothetical protein